MDIVSNPVMWQAYLIDQTNFLTQKLCMYWKGFGHMYDV